MSERKIVLVTDLSDIYRKAYGENWIYVLAGHLFANTPQEKIDELADQAHRLISWKETHDV